MSRIVWWTWRRIPETSNEDVVIVDMCELMVECECACACVVCGAEQSGGDLDQASPEISPATRPQPPSLALHVLHRILGTFLTDCLSWSVLHDVENSMDQTAIFLAVRQNPA